MLALHFGAGNIGRGFIGYLLHKTGYEVCFVDVNQQMIDSINKNNGYTVEILDDNRTSEIISPAMALNSLTQEDEVINTIVQADIITTSVGVENLPRIASILSKGLLKRAKTNRENLDIISNENAINASNKLMKEIEKHVSPFEMRDLCSFVGFPNSAIDRLALSKGSEFGDIALVEPFYEWVINKSQMVNHKLPFVNGASYVEDLTPYIERKIYLVNMAHAATAYLGFAAGEPTIQSALNNQKIEQTVRGVMTEASGYIIKKYNNSPDEMNDFIGKILARFKNKNVSDDVTRVGRSPIRKLGPEERLIKPIGELVKLGLPVNSLLEVVAAALSFAYPDDVESVKLKQFIDSNGVESAITHFTGLEDPSVIESIKEHYYELNNQKIT